ncbi:ionotropic receptor 60a [Haematobia irritans]|uniref:ionotropic receptor 60a n=1 Tax=Haematobia irritans TaxID=7368 RepID=UPI003F502618
MVVLFDGGSCIVNPNNETARMVIYLQKPSSLGPRTWLAGVNCLDQITRLFFEKRETLTRSPNMVVTIAKKMSSPAAQIQEGFLKIVMEAISEVNRTHKPYQIRIISDSKTYKSSSVNQNELVLADFYIMVIDSIERLKSLLQNYVSHMLSWNPGARFMVVYNNVNNRNNSEKTARAIFGLMLEDFYINRVGLMYATADVEYSFMLLDYFNSTACRTLSIKKFVQCREGNLVTKNVKTLKTKLSRFLTGLSLTNCTFNLCASIAAPFVENDCVLGLEMRIIGFIKARLNFNILSICERESRGIQLDTGNWSGLLGRLNEKSCDFIMGGYYPDNEVLNSFWVSDCYLQDSYTWFTKLADPRPAWMALYSIFDHFTWMVFVGMILITWVTWALLVNMLPEPPQSREWSLTGINNLGVSVCVSVQERPLCMASRFFFVALAIYGLNVTSMYTSKLISLFSNPGLLHQIDSLEEVVEAGIPFGGHEECRDWFENDQDMWIFDQYNDSSDFDPTTANLHYVKKGERVIMSSRMYIMQNALADYVFAFRYNIFSSPIQMIMKPGFPFLYEFNLMIRYMRDFGFFHKINRDFIYNNTYLNRIAKMRPDFQEKVIVLTMDHLQGAFSILSLGIGVSIILFVGELMVFHLYKPLMTRYSRINKKSLKKSKKVAKKKPHPKDKKHKLSKPVQEIVISWEEINRQTDMRFTPVKRRKVHK